MVNIIINAKISSNLDLGHRCLFILIQQIKTHKKQDIMKRTSFKIIIIVMVYCFNISASEPAIVKLLERLMPKHVDEVEFITIEPKDGKNVFSLESRGGKIIIGGDNTNSMARGLGTYIREFCHVSISWDADATFAIPENLPAIPNKKTVTCSVKNRFFFNYCTFGYTMPFWDWRKWERCIDWMALNGINAPLAITGTEKVLIEVWKKYGFSEDDMLNIFTDPTHLPWYHMNTISHWGAPCPKSYVEYGYKMEKRIVARERELGMRPIMTAFNGRVPKELSKKFPNKKVHVLGKGWGMFDEQYYTYFLDPYDPLFADIQKTYIETVQRLYGSDHLYGVDPFNEIEPPSWEPEYLAKTAKRIYSTMSAADKDAVWIQMAWLFFFDKKHWTNERIKALLTAVPKNKLVMLDYYCESKEIWKQTEAFFDVPFAWCYLGNFGGKESIAGGLPVIFEGIKNVQKERCGKNLWGIGSTLEGFGVNMATYEFLFDNVWSDMPNTIDEWIKNYAVSRCGGYDKYVVEAWLLMNKHIYNRWSSSYYAGSTLHSRPSLQGAYGFVTTTRNFTTSQLWDIWSLMMKASRETMGKDSFQYDLVNIIRQYLGDVSKQVQTMMYQAYMTGDIKKFKKAAHIFFGLGMDQEKIIRSRSEFLMGRWIKDSYKISDNANDRECFERSIRNLLTTWGGKNCPLSEYANRDWDGLTRDYYLSRWEIFVNNVVTSMQAGKPFDSKKFNQIISEFDWNYVLKNRNNYTAVPIGDTLIIAKKLFSKYGKLRLDKVKTDTTKSIIGKWDNIELTNQWKKFSWNVSKNINKTGLCVISFNYKGGAHAIQVRNVRLKCGDGVVSEDLHIGKSGNNNTNNSFRLNIDNIVPAATYTLEAEIKGISPKKEIDSKGEIVMEIFQK